MRDGPQLMRTALVRWSVSYGRCGHDGRLERRFPGSDWNELPGLRWALLRYKRQFIVLKAWLRMAAYRAQNPD